MKCLGPEKYNKLLHFHKYYFMLFIWTQFKLSYHIPFSEIIFKIIELFESLLY